MTKHLTHAESNKLIRNILKREFPDTKFRVVKRDCVTNVMWIDGPTKEEVDAWVKPFEGEGFDGMIDLPYVKTSFLLPDGNLVPAKSDGSVTAGGVNEGYRYEAPEEADEVYTGIRYVFTSRDYSEAWVARALKNVCRKYGLNEDDYEIAPPTEWGGAEIKEGWRLPEIDVGHTFKPLNGLVMKEVATFKTS